MLSATVYRKVMNPFRMVVSATIKANIANIVLFSLVDFIISANS